MKSQRTKVILIAVGTVVFAVVCAMGFLLIWKKLRERKNYIREDSIGNAVDTALSCSVSCIYVLIWSFLRDSIIYLIYKSYVLISWGWDFGAACPTISLVHDWSSHEKLLEWQQTRRRRIRSCVQGTECIEQQKLKHFEQTSTMCWTCREDFRWDKR